MRGNGVIEQPEAQAAWRLFCCNWMMLGLMAVALATALALTGFSIAPESALKPVAITGAYIGYAYYSRIWQKDPDPRVVFIHGSTGQVLLIPGLMTPLTYVAAAANLPMQDMALDALDRALGLDWMAWFNFFYERHALLVATVLAYSMIGWPVFGVPIVLGWTRRYRRLQEFTLAFGIALIATTIISAFVPAMGIYDFLKYMPDPAVFTPGAYLEQLRDLPMVRDGSLRELSFGRLAGIVTFPSFHAAAAALYLWALWPVRWLGPIAAAVNVAMLLATPIGGGHYFIDVFAGIAIAALAVVLARWIAKRITASEGIGTMQQSLGQTAA
jgi:membrane-associated phospholipid phosphatase